ncbi:MAG: polysaccharide biosynthesis C-terminal domain-containing protein [Pseudomonadota bacterium]
MRGMTYTSRTTAMSVALAAAFIGIAAIVFFADDSNVLYMGPLIIGLTSLPVLALAETQDGLSRSFDWVDMALAPTFLVRPCLILASMAGALALGFAPSAETALLCAVGSTWAVSIAQMLIVNARIDRAVPPAKYDIKQTFWLKISLPIFLVEGFFFLLTNVDILIAGAFLPPEKVAVYYAAVKTLALVHFVYFAVKAGAAHRYSQYHSGGDRALYEGFVRDTVRWTFWGSLAMGLVMVATGKFLLALFGPAFAEGYPLLCVLAVGIVIRSAVGPAESVLTMSGQQNVCALVYGVTLVMNIALNISLIPQYGLMGAAVATTIALAFEATALYAVTLRRLGLKMFIFSSAPTPQAV